jgi:hypothetical protein
MDDFFGLNFHFMLTKFYFEISACGMPFSDPLIYFIKLNVFAQNDKFSNKNDMFPACRDFKKKVLGEC